MTLNESETALQEMNCSLGNLTGCPSMDRANLTKMFFNFMNTTNFTGVSVRVVSCVDLQYSITHATGSREV